MSFKAGQHLYSALAIVFVLTVYASVGMAGAGSGSAEPGTAPKDLILFDRHKETRKEAGEISPVLFSHSTHSKPLKCPDCHPSIFAMKAGVDNVTEQGNMDGEFCGFCHGDRLSECDFCHKMPVKK